MTLSTRLRRVTTPAGDPAWFVTTYADVKQLLNDPRLGRSHPDPEHAPRYANSAIFGGPMGGSPETEHTEHAQMRALLTRSFSARRMELLRPRVQDLLDGLLGDLLRKHPPADFHAAVSFPLPVLVICELLGVPFEDHAQFRHWSDDAADMTDADRSRAALGQLFGYMLQLLNRKREAPGEDLISDLLAAQRMAPALTDQGIAQLSAGLLFAGHETTVSAIDRGIVLLATNASQREALQRKADLVATAVEEILRYPDPAQPPVAEAPGGLPRYAHTDIELDGITIKAGELVLLALHEANMDDAVFSEPEHFDVQREDNPHLTFGHGPRYCIGAPLARIELQTVMATVIARVPTLRLAVPLEALRPKSHLLTGGLAELPVTW